jgi:hypothetical protein
MRHLVLCSLLLSASCHAESPLERKLCKAAEAEAVYGLQDDRVLKTEWLLLKTTADEYISRNKLGSARESLWKEVVASDKGAEGELVRRFQTCCEDNKDELESMLSGKTEASQRTLGKLAVLYSLAYQANCAVPARIRSGVTKERLDNLTKCVTGKRG